MKYSKLLTLKYSITLLIFGLINATAYGQPTEKSTPLAPLRLGYYLNAFPDISLEDMEIALRFWSTEISNKSGVTATTTIYQKLDEMREDFYQEKINFIVANPMAIAQEFDLNQLADGFMPIPYGQVANQLIVVTHKQSNLDTFKQLKNKRLTFLLNDLTALIYADVLALKNFGKKANAVFSSIDYIHKSPRQIYTLFFKQTDVIFTYLEPYQLAIELNPQIAMQTQIIAALDNTPRGLGFFHKNTDSALRESIIRHATTKDNSPRWQQLLALFLTEQFKRATPTDIASSIKIYQQYQQLTQHKKQ